jgi:hypothetical protein
MHHCVAGWTSRPLFFANRYPKAEVGPLFTAVSVRVTLLAFWAAGTSRLQTAHCRVQRRRPIIVHGFGAIAITCGRGPRSSARQGHAGAGLRKGPGPVSLELKVAPYRSNSSHCCAFLGGAGEDPVLVGMLHPTLVFISFSSSNLRLESSPWGRAMSGMRPDSRPRRRPMTECRRSWMAVGPRCEMTGFFREIREWFLVPGLSCRRDRYSIGTGVETRERVCPGWAVPDVLQRPFLVWFPLFEENRGGAPSRRLAHRLLGFSGDQSLVTRRGEFSACGVNFVLREQAATREKQVAKVWAAPRPRFATAVWGHSNQRPAWR